MRDTRVVDTSAETVVIGLVAATLAFAASVAVVHVGSRMEDEWMHRLGDDAEDPGTARGWVVVNRADEGFRVALPGDPGSGSGGAAQPPGSGSRRRGYRLVEAGVERAWREYGIVVTTHGDGGVFDREHPLPGPLLEALVAEGLAPAARMLSRRPLVEHGCHGLEVCDVHRDGSGVAIYTRRWLFWSGPSTYAFTFSSPSQSDLTAGSAARFFGSIAIAP